MAVREYLETIFESDRLARQAEARLLDHDAKAVEDALSTAVVEAKALSDRSEATLRLERLADLCAQLPGARMADTLIAILDDDEPSVRVAAGEALLDVAYERYAEVARAIERRLAKDSGPALSELPWIIAEIAEPSAVQLIRRFLDSNDAEVVAASIEALASLGDPAAVPLLSELSSDARSVTIEDAGSELTTTIGQLAQEAARELDGAAR